MIHIIQLVLPTPKKLQLHVSNDLTPPRLCHTPWSRSHIRTHRFSHEFYDDHLGPSNSENDDNETIKNRGDYVETTIKGPDYLTSRIYRQRFTILPGKK